MDLLLLGKQILNDFERVVTHTQVQSVEKIQCMTKPVYITVVVLGRTQNQKEKILHKIDTKSPDLCG